MQYKLTIAPTKSKPLIQSSRTPPLLSLYQQLSSNFSLSTLLLAGACLQAVVLLVFNNYRYACFPAFFFLGMKLIDSFLIAYGIRPNPYMKDVFLGRRTAFVPDEDGKITDQRQSVTIMLLGAKTNSPWGIFDPKFLKLGEWLNKMNEQFDSKNPPNGFLGQTSWERKDENGAREFTFISYWRTVDNVHDYANSALHREAWMWWEKNIKELNCVGINHEMFQADPGNWENVYDNFQPTGLGATTVLRKGNKFENGVVDDEWLTPLVDARRGKLAKSSARLGREPTKYDADHLSTGGYD